MPAPRDISSELNNLLSQLPQFASSGYNLQQQYGPQYLQNALFGQPTFDSARAIQEMSPEDLAGIKVQADSTGRTPEQWLQAHVMEQRGNGDPLATRMFEQYGSNNGLVGNLGRTSGIIDDLNNRSTGAYRTAAFDDAIDLDGTKRSLNPELYSLMDTADARARNPRGASDLETLAGSFAKGSLNPTAGEDMLYRLGGAGGLAGRLGKSAEDELALGGNLSDSETSQIEQDTRRAFAARGLYDSNAAIGSELMNLDQARQQRLTDRRAFATNTASLNSGIASNLAGLAINRQNSGIYNLGAADSITSQRDAANQQALLQSIGYRSGSATDPLALINSNPGSNQASASNTLALSSGFGGSMPDYLSQLLGYGSDVNNTNFNAASAGEIASGNNSAAKTSGYVSAGAGLAGAGLTALAIF